MLKPNGVPIQTPYPMPAPDTGVMLESYLDTRHGYMRMEVTAQILKGEYFSVPRPQESWSAPAVLVDSFTLDLKQHKVV